MGIIDKFESLGITKKTDELKKLIAEHPDYPICVLAGETANGGDYAWMFCSKIWFEVAEILDADYLDYGDETFTDRDRLEEVIEDRLFDDGLDGEELDKAVKEKLAELEPYWKNVICIYADN